MVEKNHLDVLVGASLANQIDSGFLIGPEFTVKVVVDDTSITVFLLETLSKHSLKEFLGKVLEFFFLQLWGRSFTFLGSTSLGLLLCFLFLQLFKLLSLFLEHVGSFIVKRVTSLLPEVNELVKANDTSLVLLCHVVGCSGLSTGFRANHEHIHLVLGLDWRGEFYFHLVLQ
jgi:hypothetical protein